MKRYTVDLTVQKVPTLLVLSDRDFILATLEFHKKLWYTWPCRSFMCIIADMSSTSEVGAVQNYRSTIRIVPMSISLGKRNFTVLTKTTHTLQADVRLRLLFFFMFLGVFIGLSILYNLLDVLRDKNR